METLTVKLPNYTIGEDAIYKLSKIVDKYGNRVLIVGGKTALEKTHLIKATQLIMTLCGMEANVHIIIWKK